MTSKEIKIMAKKVGFDLVKITSPDPIPNAQSTYNDWLSNNMHAGMQYMGKNVERRLSPKSIMPNAKSIICLAINYYDSDIHTGHDQKNGIIARYARGEDYHRLIESKLKLFKDKVFLTINDITIEWKDYVDYGPILERAYAEKSGIGFIGRNKNLITKEFGSWVFLATCITNLELEFDNPIKFACGRCRACIDACPVKALIKKNEDPWDYEVLLDANKCISYQTIENKTDEIPSEIQAKMGNRVFGCDICQEVCPHNRKPKETKHSELKSTRGAGDTLYIKKIAKLSETQFKKQYQKTPLMRAKLKGIKRNISHLI